jgi:DNA primase
LAERAGIRLEEQELSVQDREKLDMRRRLLEMHSVAADFFHKYLMKSPDAQVARDYLKGAGLMGKSPRPGSWDTHPTLGTVFYSGQPIAA